MSETKFEKDMVERERERERNKHREQDSMEFKGNSKVRRPRIR
jgi:hypothetical protein